MHSQPSPCLVASSMHSMTTALSRLITESPKPSQPLPLPSDPLALCPVLGTMICVCEDEGTGGECPGVPKARAALQESGWD